MPLFKLLIVKQNKKVIVIGVGVLVFLLLFPNFVMGQTGMLLSVAESFIISEEGFIPVSKWDYKQYSWGYGTAAPGAGLSISESQARDELRAFVQKDYNYLNNLINVPLNSNQWAALLSFSYNEGPGNADNLVPNINAQDWDAMAAQWRLYNKVTVNNQKVFSQQLADRRERELDLFFS